MDVEVFFTLVEGNNSGIGSGKFRSVPEVVTVIDSGFNIIVARVGDEEWFVDIDIVTVVIRDVLQSVAVREFNINAVTVFEAERIKIVDS